MDTKALRQKILDLAIRGKLVPQDPNDEPASVLLERIRAQKQQMVKEGKLKAKDIKNDTVIFVGEDSLHYEKFQDGSVKCIEDEIPFEIPDGWEWCRLSHIGMTNIGLTYSPSDISNDGVMVLRSSNIVDGKIDLHDLVRVKTVIRPNQFLHNNDILLCARNGSKRLVGKCAIFEGISEPASFGAFMAIYRSEFNRFIYYFFNTDIFKKIFKSDDTKQINQLTQDMIKQTLLPLPPQAEQTRIINQLGKVISVIESIEQDKNQILQIIDAAKSRILDLAIRGKLVPQDPNDEPASVLLERIRAEKEELVKQGKIKRDKRESAIFKGEDNSYYEKIGKEIHCIDEEILFKIPDGWQWCRLGTLFSHNTGKALNSSATEGSMLTYITTSNVYWDHFELDNLKQMLFKDNEIEKCTVKKGDLLVCEGGDIGRAAIWDSSEPIRIQNHIHRLRAYGGIYTPFYYYIFYFYKKSGYIKGNGIGLQGLSSNQIHKIIVPLPPFNMQKQIVKRINILFKCLDKIETDINM